MQADASQVAIPLHAFQQARPDEGSNWFYGSLPREAVCTENLTPWLKLLPCQGRQGLTQLMDRPTLYGASFHSMTVHLAVHTQTLNNTCSPTYALDKSCPALASDAALDSTYAHSNSDSAATVTQTLTLVLRPEQLHVDEETKASFIQLGRVVLPDLDLQRLSKVPGVAACSKAARTSVYFHLSQPLVTAAEPLSNTTELHAISNKLYTIAPTPHAVVSSSSGVFALWNVSADLRQGLPDGQCLQPSIQWHQQPKHWRAPTPPVQVSSFADMHQTQLCSADY